MAKRKKKRKVSRKRKNMISLKKTRNRLILTLLVIVIIVVGIILFVNSKKITCTKSVTNGGFKIDSNVTMNLGNNKINSIKLNRTISAVDKNSNVNYINMIKSSVDELYKTSKNMYSVDAHDNELTLNVEYKETDKYIIDNIFIEKEDEGLSFNVIKEDSNLSYATFDLTKNYNKQDVIKILEKASYICK